MLLLVLKTFGVGFTIYICTICIHDLHIPCKISHSSSISGIFLALIGHLIYVTNIVSQQEPSKIPLDEALSTGKLHFEIIHCL